MAYRRTGTAAGTPSPSDVNAAFLWSRLQGQQRVQKARPSPASAELQGGLDVGLEESLCTDCRDVLLDLLAQVYPPERWTRIEEEDFAVFCHENHCSGNVGGLRQCGRDGCKVCTFLHDELRRTNSDSIWDGLQFRLVVQCRPPVLGKVLLWIGDVNRLISSLRRWDSFREHTFQLFSGFQDQYSPSQNADKHVFVSVPQRMVSCLPTFPPSDPGSDRCLDTIRSWREACIHSHTICSKRESFVPLRLVDVQNFETHRTPRLYRPSPGEELRYATVSYSWGEKEENRRLQTKNHDPKQPDRTEVKHCGGMPIDLFPLTVQHAMLVAVRLGYRYVWIDSVCIVQDSDEDWKEQSNAMTRIYAGADLNISATSGLRSEHGILRSTQREAIRVGYVLPTTNEKHTMDHDARSSDEKRLIFLGRQLPTLDLELMPTATRGWIFQERLVSPTTIHFTDGGLVWECAHHIKLNYLQGLTRATFKREWIQLMQLPSTTPNYSSEKAMRAEVFQSWNNWVAAYAARDLYKFTDRLPAVAGMARMIQDRFGLRYVWGLWYEDLVSGLLWRRHHLCKSLIRFKGDSTPSWSWASVQGRLKYVHQDLLPSHTNGPVIQVLGVSESNENDAGRTKKVRLKIKGMLQRVTVDEDLHPEVGKRASQDVGVSWGFVNTTNVQVLLDAPSESDHRTRDCWCLRFGSFEKDGRRGDVFLLLDQLPNKRFTRVGFAQTEPWSNRLSVTPDSGRFLSSEITEIILE